MTTEPLTTCNQEPLLETILGELAVALVVCDRQGYIRFCNPAAWELFRHHPGLVLGNSLYGVCQRAPIAHTLKILAQRDREGAGAGRESETGLVCATVDNSLLLHCRIRLLAIPGAAEPLMLFTFVDLTGQLAEQNRAGGALPELIEQLRHPLGNLAVAAANLQNHPRMGAEDRAAFIEIVARESADLTDRFAALVWQARATLRSPWPLSEVNSVDLFNALVQRLAEAEGPVLTISGEPLWLRADSYSLLLALEVLVRYVRELKRVREINLEALLGDRRVYLDLVWPGEPIPQAALNLLLQRALPEGGNGVTIAEVLWRHDSELWSQRHQRRGFALLRLPLPHSPRQWQGDAGPGLGALADRPLASLDYVVFDTETSGPDPAGDELLALAAVRLGPGGTFGEERFERLVRPGQPVKAGATALLGRAGEMAAGAAPLDEVLPQFRAFVGGSILVAHNGSFDLNFLRGRQEAGEAGFASLPLLDTLLLARLVEPHRPDLTLAGLAAWLGLEGTGGQTTMADCLLTARVFQGLLGRLAERGLTTLGQVLAASSRLGERPGSEGGAERRDA